MLPSLFVLAFVTWYSIWSGMLTVRCCEKYRVYSFDGVLAFIPGWGPTLERVAALLVTFNSVLSCITYVVLAGDTAVKLIPDYNEFYVRLIAQIVVTWAVYFPLSLIQLQDLAIVSWVGIVAVGYIFILVLIPANGNPDATYTVFEASFQWCFVASVGVQAYAGSYIMPCVYKTMKDRKIKSFNKALNVAYWGTFVLYAIFAVAGCVYYGKSVEGDILLSLPSNIWNHIARIGQLISVIGTYPIILNGGAVATVEGQFFDHEFETDWQRKSVVCFFTALSFVGAYLIPDLGVVNIINGAVSTASLLSIFPAMMGVYLLGGDAKFYTAYALIGVFLAIGSFAGL